MIFITYRLLGPSFCTISSPVHQMDLIVYVTPVLAASTLLGLLLRVLRKNLKRCRKVARALRRLVAEFPLKKATSRPLSKKAICEISSVVG